MEAWLSRLRVGQLDAAGLAAKSGRRGGGSPRCASSAMRMSGEDLLRGLPLPAAPLPADLLGHGPEVGDDGVAEVDAAVLARQPGLTRGRREGRPAQLDRGGGDGAGFHERAAGGDVDAQVQAIAAGEGSKDLGGGGDAQLCGDLVQATVERSGGRASRPVWRTAVSPVSSSGVRVGRASTSARRARRRQSGRSGRRRCSRTCPG
jgi:hypothetical protein